ncbi:MAG TPA: ATP-binding protein, partial [Microlunatus sp.]
MTSPTLAKIGSDGLRKLTEVALGSRPGTLAEVAAVLGRATRSRGVVLWEAPETAAATDELSVLCAWRATNTPGLAEEAPPIDPGYTVDPITQEAYVRRTLALPGTNGGNLVGLVVDAALPFTYADGSRGVLTLCGAGGLDDAAFDETAELLEVVPQVLAVRRERLTLGLVNACGDILHAADVESGSEPLPRQRLVGYFTTVCERLSEAMQEAEVALFLEEPGCEGRYDHFAGWPIAASGAHPPSVAEADGCRHQLRPGERSIDQRLMSGTHTWGILRCTRPAGLPDYFTHSDLSLLRPVAAQLARHWATWLNRRALSEENRSWWALASGITEFNKVLADALRGAESTTADQPTVAEAALRVASTVVPAASGAAVFSAAPAGKRKSPSLVVTAQSGLSDHLRTRHDQATRAYGSGVQRISSGSTDATGAERWMVSTPIRVGNQAYGTLTAEGIGAEPPANSAQVYEILSDQLGLYRHLERTMSQLKAAQRELNANLNAQAEVMEDLKHQLVSPLRAATDRTDLVIRQGQFDRRTQRELAAARGLCRKASRVAMSAGVFAALSKGERPTARSELLGAGDLQRMLVAGADDCRILSNPEMRRSFEVDRASLSGIGRTLVHADSSFLQQCVGNLLDNADKYSYPETEVRVAVAAPIGADRHLRITVTSTGLPLLVEDRIRCLERSWRGSAAR